MEDRVVSLTISVGLILAIATLFLDSHYHEATHPRSNLSRTLETELQLAPICVRRAFGLYAEIASGFHWLQREDVITQISQSVFALAPSATPTQSPQEAGYQELNRRFAINLQNILETWYGAVDVQFSEVGQLMFSALMKHILQSRLDVTQHQIDKYHIHSVHHLAALAEEDHIQGNDIVIVTGLYRSGTTLLSKLLGLDHQQAQFLTLPEVIHPAANNRIKRQWFRWKRKTLGYTAFCNGSAFYDTTVHRVHRIKDDDPEEEMALMMAAGSPGPFAHLLTDKTLQQVVLSPTDNTTSDDVYHYLKMALATILEQRVSENISNRRILLKSPQHAYHIHRLRQHFPTATVIVLRRQLHSSMVASWLTSLLYMMPMFDLHHMRNFQLPLYGQSVLRHLVHMHNQLDRFVELEQLRPAVSQKLIEVDYNALVEKPVETIKWIYEQANWTLTHQYQSQLEHYVQSSEMSRPTGMKYNLSYFGLTPEVVAAAFQTAPPLSLLL